MLVYRDIRASSTLVFAGISEGAAVASLLGGNVQLDDDVASGGLLSNVVTSLLGGTVQLGDDVASGSLLSQAVTSLLGGTVQLGDDVFSGALSNSQVPDPLCAARVLLVSADVLRAPLEIRAPQAGWVKDVDEVLDYGADFSQVMSQLTDDSIAGATATGTLDLMVLSSALRGNVVATMVGGGTPGRVSTLTMRITTQKGRVVDAPLYIQVITK